MSLARDLADLAGEANGIGNSITANSSAITAISVGGENLSPVQSFRNKIINGNFDIWQRGTSVTGVTNGQFVADRFRPGLVGSTANVSRQSFTLGQTDVPNEPTYFHRTVVSSVAGSGNYFILAQLIEFVRTLAGQTATLSFWAKADASKNIAVEFVQEFGTGGSPSSGITKIGLTTCALTTSWQKFTITVSIPSISGKALGTDNNDFLGILFWFDAGSDFNSRTNSLGQQSGTFDIAQVQLEAGSVATPFEQRPIGTELALCQRYYCKSSKFDVVPVVGAHYTTTGMFSAGVASQFSVIDGYIQTISFPMQMRTYPTITTYPPSLAGTATGQLSVLHLGVGWIVGSTSIQALTTANFCLYYTTASATNGATIYYGAWTADAEL